MSPTMHAAWRGLVRCGVAVLAILLSACGVDPDVEYAAAEQAYSAGNARTAMIHVSNLLQARPEHVAGRVLRGRLALLSGDAQSARDELQRAASLGAVGIDVWLADATSRLGAHDEALQLLDGVPESNHDPEYWVVRAETLLRVQRVREAAAAVARAVAAAPSPLSRALLVQARVAARDGQQDAADGFYAQAIAAAASARERADAYGARGGAFVATQRLTEAAADLSQAADLYATDNVSVGEVGALSTLVQVHLAQNDVPSAADVAERLARRAPSAPISNYVKALVAYQTGRLDEAVSLLQQAVNQVPDDPLFVTLLGAGHLAKGDIYQAEQQLLRALAIAPDDPAAVKLLAETRLRQQRPEAALDALRPLAGTSSDPQLDALQGMASVQAGNFEEGILYLQQAAAASPGNQALRLELARAYIAAGRSAEASSLLAGVTAGDGAAGAAVMSLFAALDSGDMTTAGERAATLLQTYATDAQAQAAVAVFEQLSGRKPEAIARLQEAIRIDERFVQARLVLAGLLIEDGRTQEAEGQLENVLAIEPEHAVALAGKAQVAISRGGLDEAAVYLRRSIQSSSTIGTRVALTRVYLRLDDVVGARREIDNATAAAPDNPEVLAADGLVALAEQRYSDAIRLLRSARERLPGRVDIALALAQAQAATNDLRGGRDTLVVAARTAPRSLSLQAALGALELRLGNADEAVRLAKQIQVDFPQLATGYLLEADVRIAQRRYSIAADSLELGFERARSFEALSRWMLTLQLGNRVTEIEPIVRRWLEDNPDHVDARLLLGNVFEALERPEDALAEYDRVVDLAADNVMALNNSAWLRYSLDRPGALERAQRAYEIAPENAAVLDTLGWILAQQGRASEGIRYLEQAADRASRIPDIQYHYASVLAELGRRDTAREVLTRILRDNEPFPSRAAAQGLLSQL